MVPFNKTNLTGQDIVYIIEALQSGKIAGDGKFTKACETIFENKYGFLKTFLTTSCTHAIELASLLIDVKSGDEIIMPSYTFVSSANPFILRGAKIVFADSCANSPNIDVNLIEALITPKTKAILIIHYGGICCEITRLRMLADKHGLFLIEDAAQALNSYFNGKPAGSFGHMATFSFHETKNITCGEGGLLVVNDERFIKRAEILREKGTNRASFSRGEVSKYTWVDVGSSYILSEILAALLLAQLEQIDQIQEKRLAIWHKYYKELIVLQNNGLIDLASVSVDRLHNAHTFYFTCRSAKISENFITFMANNGVHVQFHYIPLHNSPFYSKTHGNRKLPMASYFGTHLIRLPLFNDLKNEEVKMIIELTLQYFNTERNL